MIDDDRPSTDLLTVYLESAGFEVSSAQDGPSGLEATRRMNPVAVVLDILLPLVNGWDVLAALKRDPETTAIPVIVVSIVDERGEGPLARRHLSRQARQPRPPVSRAGPGG